MTIIALGIWLILFEKNKKLGVIAIFIGGCWFIIATQVIMPMVNAGAERFASRYSDLGSSYSEILINIFAKPNLLFGKIFSTETLIYLLLLFAPFIWYFRFFNLNYLIVALPAIAMNILSVDPQQRYLANHYPLPIFPLLMLIAVFWDKGIY